MARGLGRCSLALLATALLGIHARADGPAKSSAAAPVLERYLALDHASPSDVRALRHLEAHNEQFNSSAWMDVWTEADASGFRYRVIGEGGSDYIRSRVFRACLEGERKMWAEDAPGSTALTPANYVFEAAGMQADGLTSFLVRPRRKDALLVNGSIYLDPDDGDLVRVEGRLIKPPSFWTRRVDVVRWYRRFAGTRLPIALESVADVRIAGESTFRMTYDYEFVNSQRVGFPQPLLAYAAARR
jgi:hypothetical protein